MNVLFISHSGRRNGGAQSVMFNLMKELPKDLFSCQCIFPERGAFMDEVAAAGIKSHKQGFMWWAGFELDTLYKIPDCLWNIRISVEPIIKIIQNEKIDVVVSNTISMCEGALAARIAKVPHVWYIHEILSRDPKMKHMINMEFLYYIALQMSEAVVAISDSVRKEIEAHIGGPSKKIFVIHNGIKSSRPDFTRVRNHSILSVGGVCRRKGQMALLKAARIVCDKIPDAHFYIAGKFWEREYRQQLLDTRVELGLEKNWSFLKWVEDIDTFYRNGAVLTSTATCEPFGLSVLEAMNRGLPVVTTDSGGPSEIVENGKTGIVVPVDDVQAIADGILYLLWNPEEADNMGKRGYERATTLFQHKPSVDSFANVLKSVGGGGKNYGHT